MSTLCFCLNWHRQMRARWKEWLMQQCSVMLFLDFTHSKQWKKHSKLFFVCTMLFIQKHTTWTSSWHWSNNMLWQSLRLSMNCVYLQILLCSTATISFPRPICWIAHN